MEREQAMIMDDNELKKFFESQYLTTSKLPRHRQRQVKREILAVINHQEEEHELESFIGSTG